MTKYNHLSKEQRNIIEHLLCMNNSFTYIGNAINVDRTTISKEVRRNRYIKSNFYDPFDIKGIESAIKKCNKLKNHLMFVIPVQTKDIVLIINYITMLELLINIVILFFLNLDQVLILILMLLMKLKTLSFP